MNLWEDFYLRTFWEDYKISPLDIKILGWCPVKRLTSSGGGGGVGGAALALIGCPSSDGVTIKMPYGIDVLHRPALHLIFSHCFG